jgi:hypothetical protein
MVPRKVDGAPATLRGTIVAELQRHPDPRLQQIGAPDPAQTPSVPVGQ